MKKGPQSYNLSDVWTQYVYNILAVNPTWVGMKKDGSPMPYYYIYRKDYTDEGKLEVTELFSYKLFREIISRFFQKSKEHLIEGRAISMTNNLGKIIIRRVERMHRKKTINYAKTLQQPKVWCPIRQKEIREKIIYFTDDDYCRVGWHKVGKVKNESAYKFVPSKQSYTGVGFGQQLSRALNADPLLKYRYIYYPVK